MSLFDCLQDLSCHDCIHYNRKSDSDVCLYKPMLSSVYLFIYLFICHERKATVAEPAKVMWPLRHVFSVYVALCT